MKFAGYMALTLLVESGLLGSLWAQGKSALQQCWGGLRGRRHRRQGYAPLDEESPLGDDELEDEDVKAERMALQTGAYQVFSHAEQPNDLAVPACKHA